MSQDYYETLGVSRSASADEIKKAYRKLARQLHPDVNPDPEVQEQFKFVTNAYEVLSDPRKRERYDMGGDPLSRNGGGMGGQGMGDAGFTFTDIMDAFFGGQGGGNGRGPIPRTRRGQDALIGVRVDLADAVFGAEREITVDTAVLCGTCAGAGTSPGTDINTCSVCGGRGEVQSVQRSFLGQVMTSRPCAQCQGHGTVIPHPCTECSGEGRVRARRTITLRIPAGVDDGTRLQLAGQGEVGAGGGPAADLYVQLDVAPHPVFARDGQDLHCRATVPMTQAALGTTLSLTGLNGAELSADIAAGTQSGARLVLAGEGVPLLRPGSRSDDHGRRGDLIVGVEVSTPTRLDDEQVALLSQLAKVRGEEGVGGVTPRGKHQHGGVFGWIKDAFNG
ncbi:MAG TPA: molecular chaperone DnaJ [Actinopolymorphaceae bacterium]|jgi:molecular chaperone DnaJ